MAVLTRGEDVAEAPDDAISRWPFPDDRVHGAREPYVDLAAGFGAQCRRLLRPDLASMPAGTEVWLFSEHGFVERSGTPRYTHGGDSPEEVVLPWPRLVRR